MTATDGNEIAEFIEIKVHMGIAEMPSVEKYWSTEVLYPKIPFHLY